MNYRFPISILQYRAEMVFCPGLLVIGEACFSEAWKVFPHLLLWLLLQCTSTANPFLVPQKTSQMLLLALLLLQRVNVIAVIGLGSALSQLTAPPLCQERNRTGELYLESQEQHRGDRQPSNKPYFFHSRWAKVQLHANTTKSSRVGRL